MKDNKQKKKETYISDIQYLIIEDRGDIKKDTTYCIFKVNTSSYLELKEVVILPQPLKYERQTKHPTCKLTIAILR